MNSSYYTKEKEINRKIENWINECVNSFTANYTNDTIEDAETYVAYNLETWSNSIEYICVKLFEEYQNQFGQELVRRKFGTLEQFEKNFLDHLFGSLLMPKIMYEFMEDVVYNGYKINMQSLQGKLNKVTRGRFVGGGFGVTGAMRGMLTAGILNGIAGLGYSAANLIADTYRIVKLRNSILNRILNREHRDYLAHELREDLKVFLILNNGVGNFMSN